jgi:WD40 repeat protein
VLRSVFSQDGAVLVSGSFDETLKVWDALNWGTEITTLGNVEEVSSSVFSPDGAVMVSGSWRTLKVGVGRKELEEGDRLDFLA